MGYDFRENSEENIDREKFKKNHDKIDWDYSKKKKEKEEKEKEADES